MPDADAIVVGAGITGLAAALRLCERGLSVVVLEGAPRAGGAIRTERRDGYLLEWGPHSALASARPVFRLARQAGLEWVRGERSARRRAVMRGGRLRALPAGPFGILASGALPFAARLRLLAEPLVRARGPDEETVEAFIRRRFGAAAARTLADPLVGGIYGGLPEELELAAAFPALARLEREWGSVALGALRGGLRARRGRAEPGGADAPPERRGTFALREGMEALPRALAARLGGALRLSSPVAAIARSGGLWRVRTALGELATPRLLLAAPVATSAAHLDGVDRELAALVGAIPTASLALVALGLDRARAPGPLDGFGFLVPRGEPAAILGAIYGSSLFPFRAPPGKALVTVFIGGRRRPGDAALPDAALIELAVRDLGLALGGPIEPELAAVGRAPQAIPQLVRGHRRRVAMIRTRLAAHPGLALAGGWLGGVAMSGCIDSGERAAEELAKSGAGSGDAGLRPASGPGSGPGPC